MRHLAMWSGPRNVSTALMRAFEQRADTWVVDEPLYAAYLARTGKDHPGRDAILASQATDYAVLADQLTGPIPHHRAISYQKHMAHHLLPDARGPWLDRLTHAFLIRDPEEMLSSLLRVWPDAELEDTGLPQQVALFEEVRARTGRAPPVINGRDVMSQPAQTLRALCDAVGLSWDTAMLAWPAGRRPTDGVWAAHWYSAVESSTGFTPWQPRTTHIPPSKAALLDQCQALYARLTPHAIGASAEP